MTNLKSIQKDCLDGRLGVMEAVEQIDQAIGGITRVDFKEGHKFKITNHVAVFPLGVSGYRRREEERLYALAVAAYYKAQQNGSVFPGEVHISAQASTKHHRQGIQEIYQRYVQ